MLLKMDILKIRISKIRNYIIKKYLTEKIDAKYKLKIQNMKKITNFSEAVALKILMNSSGRISVSYLRTHASTIMENRY